MSQETYNDVTIVFTPSGGEAVTIAHTTCTLDDGAGEAETTAVGDAGHTAADGISALSVQVAFKGSGAGLVLGAWGGALAIAGHAGGLACCGIFEKTVSGQEDGAIEGSATFLPTPAAA